MNMFPYSDFVGQILPRVEIDGAVSNWKDDSEEYHRIQDILMDIKTLMTMEDIMADVLTKEQRHRNMKNIHGKDTKIEVMLRKALWNKGYRYRKNDKMLPGSPDIVLTKYKIAIFCDGEFFHGKDWEVLKPRLEKSNNSEFWISKISGNRERDDVVNKRLLFEGWTVIRFWGDEIKKHVDECVKVVEEAIFDMAMSEGEEL